MSQARSFTAEESTTINLFKKATPSVVSVTNLATRRDAFTMNMMEIPQGAGSGFVWDKEGHIVTNAHVINESANVRVTLGQDEYMARVVGVDMDKDIAVLQ
ncbi:htrA-like protein, partial [Haematococcus lacustris]